VAKDRMAEVIFYEWGIARWLSSRTRMALDSSGRNIYRELLDLCYAQGSIPRDPSVLIRHCAATQEEWDRSWPVISRHFHVDKHDSESLVNDTANVFRRNYFKYREQQRKNVKSKGSVKPTVVKEIRNGGLTTVENNLNDGSTKTRQDKTIQEEVSNWNAATDPDAIVERMRAAHPKPSSRVLVQTAMFNAVSAGVNPVLVEESHKLWCATEGWTEKSGQYAPKLEEWIDNEGYLKRPNKDPPKPSTSNSLMDRTKALWEKRIAEGNSPI